MTKQKNKVEYKVLITSLIVGLGSGFMAGVSTMFTFFIYGAGLFLVAILANLIYRRSIVGLVVGFIAGFGVGIFFFDLTSGLVDGTFLMNILAGFILISIYGFLFSFIYLLICLPSGKESSSKNTTPCYL